MQLGAEADEYVGKLAAEGACPAPETCCCPSATSMWIVKGERQVIEDLVGGDEVRLMLEKGTLFLQDWRRTLAKTSSSCASTPLN